MRTLFFVALALAGVGWFEISSSTRDAGSASSDPGESTAAPYPAGSNWGRKLNPANTVFERGFKVFYFNRNSPSANTFEEHVDNIAVKYAWDQLHNIDSPTFSAYWVGKLRFDKPGTRQISVSQSWAKSRIFIDGELVHDKGQGVFNHEFKAGDHLIEVEYINNWHTVEFKVTIDDVVERRSREEIASLLGSSDLDAADLYYVGLYESSNTDTSVDVRLPRTGRPAIVWLDSYEAIDWNIVAPDGLKAAVIAAYSPGSRLVGASATTLLHAEKGFGVRHKTPRCSCAAGHFHCEGDNDLKNVAEELEKITNRRLDGYVAQYSAALVSIRSWNSGARLEIDEIGAAHARAEQQCRAQSNPDFDTLLD